MNMTTFLLDPRVLDDCVSDSTPDVEIDGEVAAFVKYKGQSLPDYVFYVTDSDPYKRAIVSAKLLSLPCKKREDQFNGKKRTILQYERANVVLMPHVIRPELPLLVDALHSEVLYARGDFLKGNADTFRLYGLAIKADEDKKNG